MRRIEAEEREESKGSSSTLSVAHDHAIFVRFYPHNSLIIGIADAEIACRSGVCNNSSLEHAHGVFARSCGLN